MGSQRRISKRVDTLTDSPTLGTTHYFPMAPPSDVVQNDILDESKEKVIVTTNGKKLHDPGQKQRFGGLFVHAMWFMASIIIAATAAWWGIHVGAKHQFKTYHAKLKDSDQSRAQHVHGIAHTAAQMPDPAMLLSSSEASRPAMTGDFSRLVCQDVPSAEWGEVKVLFVEQLGMWSAGTVPQDNRQLQQLHNAAMLRLKTANDSASECGMGHLSMAMLTILAQEGGAALPTLPAQLRNVLLDVPWTLIARSGWPIFALLAQLRLKTRGGDGLPPIESHGTDYLHAIIESLQKQSPADLVSLGAEYVQREGSHQMGEDTMPFLCALASHLLGQNFEDLLEAGLRDVQSLFQLSVQSDEELKASVTSDWPFYGVLHTAVLRLSKGSTKGRP